MLLQKMGKTFVPVNRNRQPRMHAEIHFRGVNRVNRVNLAAASGT